MSKQSPRPAQMLLDSSIAKGKTQRRRGHEVRIRARGGGERPGPSGPSSREEEEPTSSSIADRTGDVTGHGSGSALLAASDPNTSSMETRAAGDERRELITTNATHQRSQSFPLKPSNL